jgi:hypothetical protein
MQKVVIALVLVLLYGLTWPASPRVTTASGLELFASDARVSETSDGATLTLTAESPAQMLIETARASWFEWHPQPALTPEQRASGHHRPERVVGSYAVYWRSFPESRVFGNVKAAHVYRPRVVDATGRSFLADMVFDDGRLWITPPATATYPATVTLTVGNGRSGESWRPSVLHADTFGDTTPGASQHGLNNIYCSDASPAASGTTTTVHTYIAQYFGGAAALGNAIYGDTGSNPSGSALAVDGGDTTVNASAQWFTTNVSLAVTNGVTYHLCSWLSTVNADIAYDASTDRATAEAAAFETWPTTDFTFEDIDELVSIYATFTATGVAGR